MSAGGAGEAGTTPAAPVKKAVKKSGRRSKDKDTVVKATELEAKGAGDKRTRDQLIPGDNVASIAAVCRNSGCGEQGQTKYVRIPRLATVILLPGDVMCAVCGRVMKWDRDDVHVDRVER